jgi:phenylpropionate dioxygenase-like ring-hydroxylating dioxygenase large terminal subunit
MSLDPAAMQAAKQPLTRARSMPAGFYTDPEIFTAEREAFLLNYWFFLTRAEELPNPGDYRAFDSPGGLIVLIRGADGLLRCFANVCRHRGSILLEGQGNTGGRIT